MAQDAEFDIAGAMETLEEGLGLGLELEEGGEELVKEAIAETPPAVTEAVPAAPSTEAPAATVPSVEAPPKTWRPDALTEWEKLPAKVRAEVIKREDDMFRGLESYKQKAQFGESFQGVLQPHLTLLQQQGIEPVGHVGNLLKAHAMLSTAPPEARHQMFTQLARDYGINLQFLAQTAQSYVPPTPEVVDLQRRLNELQSITSRNEQMQLQAKEAQLNAQIEKFQSNPANIHFATVANDMVELLSRGISTTLEDAYERAVWTNPATRSLEQARVSAEAQAKAAKALADNTAAAKKAASANVRTSTKKGSATAATGSMEKTLEETLAEIKSRS
jgi:hypothetical protein